MRESSKDLHTCTKRWELKKIILYFLGAKLRELIQVGISKREQRTDIIVIIKSILRR